MSVFQEVAALLAIASAVGLVALARALGGGIALVGVAALFMRYLAEPLLSRMAREPALLVVFAIGWAAVGAAAAGAAGLSKEFGGLLAGVSLGSISVREAIAARLAPLREDQPAEAGEAPRRPIILCGLGHAETRGALLGADLVLAPFADAADEAVQRILAAPAARPAAG